MLLKNRRVVLALVALGLFLAWKRKKSRSKKRAIIVDELKSQSQHGETRNRFHKVQQTFRELIEQGREHGAQLCCYVDGECVVNTYGGVSEERMMGKDSLAVVFSCTKVIESFAVAKLVDQGKLDYDTPIAQYWPGFGEKVSKTITVSHLMAHQGGVSALQKPPKALEGMELFKGEAAKLREFLENNEPEWKDGDKQLYHALTRGMYVDVLCRIVDGRSVAQFVKEEIVSIVQANAQTKVEFSIGCPDEWQHRVVHHAALRSKLYVVSSFLAHLVLPRFILEKLFDPEMDLLFDFEVELMKNIVTKPEIRRSFQLFSDAPIDASALANDPVYRTAPLASAFGISNASSMATIANTLLCKPGLILSPEGFKQAVAQSKCSVLKDDSLGRALTFSKCGLGLDRFDMFGCPGWKGWAGMGGSLFCFHEESQAVIAYVVNGLNSRLYKARGVKLLKAFQEGILQPNKN